MDTDENLETRVSNFTQELDEFMNQTVGSGNFEIIDDQPTTKVLENNPLQLIRSTYVIDPDDLPDRPSVRVAITGYIDQDLLNVAQHIGKSFVNFYTNDAEKMFQFPILPTVSLYNMLGYDYVKEKFENLFRMVGIPEYFIERDEGYLWLVLLMLDTMPGDFHETKDKWGNIPPLSMLDLIGREQFELREYLGSEINLPAFTYAILTGVLPRYHPEAFDRYEVDFHGCYTGGFSSIYASLYNICFKECDLLDNYDGITSPYMVFDFRNMVINEEGDEMKGMDYILDKIDDYVDQPANIVVPQIESSIGVVYAPQSVRCNGQAFMFTEHVFNSNDMFNNNGTVTLRQLFQEFENMYSEREYDKDVVNDALIPFKSSEIVNALFLGPAHKSRKELVEALNEILLYNITQYVVSASGKIYVVNPFTSSGFELQNLTYLYRSSVEVFHSPSLLAILSYNGDNGWNEYRKARMNELINYGNRRIGWDGEDINTLIILFSYLYIFIQAYNSTNSGIAKDKDNVKYRFEIYHIQRLLRNVLDKVERFKSYPVEYYSAVKSFGGFCPVPDSHINIGDLANEDSTPKFHTTMSRMNYITPLVMAKTAGFLNKFKVDLPSVLSMKHISNVMEEYYPFESAPFDLIEEANIIPIGDVRRNTMNICNMIERSSTIQNI